MFSPSEVFELVLIVFFVGLEQVFLFFTSKNEFKDEQLLLFLVFSFSKCFCFLILGMSLMDD